MTDASAATAVTKTADVVIVGGGPAGLSAALNLARARLDVVLVDAGRPRNAATLRSHGFLTRDGVPPIELRKLARSDLDGYPNVRILDRAVATAARRVHADSGMPFETTVRTRTGEVNIRSRALVVASGLHETLPDVTGIRSFYGMSLFSCAACDAWELQGRRLALIGETPDLAQRARLIAHWTDRLTVFTNGADVVPADEEAGLACAGVRVERRRIVDIDGERGAVSAIVVAGGERIEVEGGFVRPLWAPALEFLRPVPVDLDDEGHLVTDRSGRTSVDGLYSAGDAASGPQQLIVAAGQGARVAAVLVQDLLGVISAH